MTPARLLHSLIPAGRYWHCGGVPLWLAVRMVGGSR
jgi:hypothetical protein